MSDSSSDEERPNFDYGNCIVTHNEDTDDSFHFDPETSTNEIDNGDSFMDITCEQISNVELNSGDAFVFMLGTLNRIEKYLNNLDEGNHKKWLQSKILILKTVLIKNCDLFQSEVKDINGTLYIANTDSKKNVKEKDLSKSKKAKKQSLINQSQDEAEPPLPMAPETKTDDNVKPDESEVRYSETVGDNRKSTGRKLKSGNKELNRRRSERLQNIPEERKGLCADRMAYIIWKMESCKTWLGKTDSQNSNETGKQKTQSKNLVRNIFSKSAGETKSGRVNTKRVAISGIKSLNEAEDKEDVQNDIKKIIRRKARSLGMNLNKNVACEATVSGVASKKDQQNDKKVQVKKRRAASVGGRVSKKAKVAVDQLPETCQAEMSTTSLGKRKLYSEDSWLQSCGTFFQNTPPHN